MPEIRSPPRAPLDETFIVMQFTVQHRRLLIFAAAVSLASGAWAQPPQITSELEVQRVETVDGQTLLKPAQVSKPGDILEYRVSYSNHSRSAISGLIANLPIPTGTTLIDRSTLPSDALASTDGAHFAPLPLRRLVKLADGREREVDVPLEEYRALRWNLGTLAAGSARQVQARVRVNAVP
jgi:uncharacterized repeat protein (TIGR01451 family)